MNLLRPRRSSLLDTESETKRYSSGYVNVRATDFILSAPHRFAPSAEPDLVPLDTSPRPPSYNFSEASTQHPPFPPQVLNTEEHVTILPTPPPPPAQTFLIPDEERLGRIRQIASARRLPELEADNENNDDDDDDFTSDSEVEVIEPPTRTFRRSLRSSSRRLSARRDSGRFESTRRDSGRHDASSSTRQNRRRSRRAEEFVVDAEQAPAARLRNSWHEPVLENNVVPLDGCRKREEREVDNIILWPRPERPALLWQPSAARMPHPPPPPPQLPSLSMSLLPSESDISDSADGPECVPRANEKNSDMRIAPIVHGFFAKGSMTCSQSSVTSDARDSCEERDAEQEPESPFLNWHHASPQFSARRISHRLLDSVRIGKRSSDGSCSRSSRSSRSGISLPGSGRLSLSRQSTRNSLDNGDDTEYYQDEYCKFLENKPKSLSPLKGLSLNRIRLSDVDREWGKDYRSNMAVANESALSVTTSDDEYSPENV